jgi:hypothetical protein
MAVGEPAAPTVGEVIGLPSVGEAEVICCAVGVAVGFPTVLVLGWTAATTPRANKTKEATASGTASRLLILDLLLTPCTKSRPEV